MLKLYDFKSSPNCQRVKVVLEEKKIPYETVNVDLRAGEQKTPDYLKINPYGKVPAIADGDTVLYESCIINEYLDEKYPATRLMPTDPGARAKARILVDFGLTQMDSAYTKLRMEMTNRPGQSREGRNVEHPGNRCGSEGAGAQRPNESRQSGGGQS